MQPVRIACVQYLNTVPLIDGLDSLAAIELIRAVPSRIAALVEGGDADIGLVSLIDAARADGRLALLPAGMIGCDGPTLTVRLFSSVPIDRITAVHADTDSHTSVALCRIVLDRLHGLRPDIIDFDAREGMAVSSSSGPRLADRDAPPQTMLLIGDKVVTHAPAPADYPHQLDLGQAWHELTSLPFVYAVWMCRAGEQDSPRIRTAAAILDRQLRHNQTRLGWIVGRRAAEHRWPADLAAEYLGSLMRYRIGDREREAVGRFFDESSRLGLVSPAAAPAWTDTRALAAGAEPMPPLPRLKTPALDALARHLAGADALALARDADRAEELAGEVEPERLYPLEWIAFRITGRRAELQPPELAALLRSSAGASELSVKGAALLADLSALVERLTAAAPGRPPEGALDSAALAARWRVSRKTIDRCRRRGLVARRILGPNSRPMLVFHRSVVERFEARNKAELAAAGSYSRIAPDDSGRIVERGRRYARAGVSLNEAAKRLANRHQRSHEAVRQLLRRADATAAEPAFRAPPPPASKRRRIAYRAWRRALEPALVAERFGRSRASVVRLINDHRAEVLHGLELPELAASAEGHGERGARKWLTPAPVRTELGAPGHTDLLALIDASRRPEVPIGIVESTRASAYHFLLSEARRLIAGIPLKGGHPTDIDKAETMLRWAARLKAELVRAQIGLTVRTIEAQIDGPIDRLRAPDARALVALGLAAAAAAVDAFDPFKKSGRLAAPTSLHVNRAASRWVRENRPALERGARATPRMRPGTPMIDWTLRIAPWQALLEPDPRVRAAALAPSPVLPARERAFLLDRFGWSGGPPRTLAEMAGSLKLTPMRAAQRERLATRGALEAWRSQRAGG